MANNVKTIGDLEAGFFRKTVFAGMLLANLDEDVRKGVYPHNWSGRGDLFQTVAAMYEDSFLFPDLEEYRPLTKTIRDSSAIYDTDTATKAARDLEERLIKDLGLDVSKTKHEVGFA